ncbi:flagellar protein FlaG [Brevundimonas sp. SORGH_AS_0993]|uniref:flagellar protein FlaG n=1 Tax=Brevundimonas sp. SORGH_AS_0993 TaxID=3041794 RepID=UPI002785367C|nr:flagellar protein FlaG [Brevundimonas sp. SORGH_AS_0993]MDQ1154009.1 flagellar protein FlaG [Brevundimonas sp. SORGH_AS_0993]
MTENVVRITNPPVVPSSTPAVAPHPQAQPEPRNDNADAGRYRLTIEAVGENRYVYKVLDRVTGEVIRQLPREEVEKLSGDPTYRGGKIFDTTV